MTLTAPAVPTTEDLPAGPGMWLTTVLRPAGPMSARDGARFAAALRAASDSSGVVLVDLRAVGRLPRAVRRALTDADAHLTDTGGVLLLIDADLSGSARPPAHLLGDGTRP
jgi:hypothetical protein